MLRPIGLHIRFTGSLLEVINKAIQLNVPIFQCFFVLQSTGKMVVMNDDEINEFVFLRKQFGNLYVHGSYWINLSSLLHNGFKAFQRELALAKKLEFSHMVLHSGTAKGAQDRLEGIDALASILNRVLKRERDIQFVLENTTHGNLTIGSNISDFNVLLHKIDEPERISFSVDTAHAYGYGYNIRTQTGQEEFIALLDEMIGIDKIVLIHLNDTQEKLGSRIDRHAMIGQGKIGEEALKRFILNPRLVHIPIIMEPPVILENEEVNMLKKVISWHT